MLTGFPVLNAEPTANALFMNLNEATRNEYKKTFQTAVEEFQQKRIFTAIEHLKKAEKIFPKDVNAIFFRGLCYAELNEFAKAKEFYEAALELEPKHFGVRVNMAELAFFQHRWDSAYSQYNALVTDSPERLGDTKSLTEMKMLICASYLASGEETKEKYAEIYKQLSGRYSYLDDTPYHYYASALQSYRQGKNEEGLEWVLKAYRVFSDPAKLTLWDKTLTDCGYLKEHEIIINVNIE